MKSGTSTHLAVIAIEISNLIYSAFSFEIMDLVHMYFEYTPSLYEHVLVAKTRYVLVWHNCICQTTMLNKLNAKQIIQEHILW